MAIEERHITVACALHVPPKEKLSGRYKVFDSSTLDFSIYSPSPRQHVFSIEINPYNLHQDTPSMMVDTAMLSLENA